MSRMSDVHVEIEEAIYEGALTFEQIAVKLGVPVEWVVSVEEQMCECESVSLDGDHASALASAGWGTDEDYGDLPF